MQRVLMSLASFLPCREHSAAVEGAMQCAAFHLSAEFDDDVCMQKYYHLLLSDFFLQASTTLNDMEDELLVGPSNFSSNTSSIASQSTPDFALLQVCIAFFSR